MFAVLTNVRMNSRKQSFSDAPVLVVPSYKRVTKIVAKLTSWGPKRMFPWRTNDSTAFQIFLSESLLTRTGADKVSLIIAKFRETFPTPNALASANPQEVIKLISPLGLHKRGEMLIESAKRIAEVGEIKNDRAWLIGLPGVGRYVADAVRVMAFGECVLPIVTFPRS